MSQVEHHQSGIGYWRSLEQLADTPEVRDLLVKEFPGYDPTAMATGTSRRRFLKLMGASLAMAGLTLTGCRRWPDEKLAPYSSNPQGRIPGVPEQYATVWEVGGVGHGLLVTSFDGRPIKIEGNPSHPMARTANGRYGATDAFAQASILEMYDPQRSREVIDRSNGGGGKVVAWDAFGKTASAIFGKLKGSGAGLAILSEGTASPSALDMKKRVLAAFPQAKWYEYEALTRDAELEGSRAAFGGKALRSVLHLDKADVVVSLDADLLGSHPAHVRYSADWAEKRRGADHGEMNRVYIAETCFTTTGTVADARVAVGPDRIYVLARALAVKLGVAGVTGEEKLTEVETKFVDSAAADLKGASGNAVVAVGQSAPAYVHALAHAINEKIGAVGKAVTLIEEPAGDRPTDLAAIMDLSKQMADGKVGTLVILGGNPAYDAPIDADFAAGLAKVGQTIRLGLYDDETSKLCKWHVPRAHYLESWGDARGWDGSVSITQPLIEALFGGKSVIEFLAIMTGDSVTVGDQIVRRTWKEQFIKGGDFETAYKRALEAGVLEGSALPAVSATASLKPLPAVGAGPTADKLVLKFEQDSHTYDGRFANNGWLQETHDPLTKLIWDNAVLISVKDATRLSLKTNDVVTISCNGKYLEAAVYVMPGQPVGVLGLTLGYGRTAGTDKEQRVGDKLGFNGYSIRASTTPWVVNDLTVTKKGQTYTLATTSVHHLIDEIGMKGREDRVGGKGKTGMIVHEATLAEFKKSPKAIHGEDESSNKLQLQLFDTMSYNGPHAWGMTIDLNTCTGCNACVVACQAENNIPIVGKDQALMHREMGWLRIDRYFKGDSEDPQIDVVHQPMMCVHCENAPCEQVCPVAATMHDTEGLNVMVYNRCIGTRYCSNNCPYKVRRFNYFDWHAKPPRNWTGSTFLMGLPDMQQNDPKAVDPIRRMQFNPDVTVRMRGVMEKCTYCTQRIQRTKIARRNAGQEIADGEILTACQQSCATQAIVFGDLRNKESAVSGLQKNPRAYDLLGELNTRPRTKYLAKLRNPAGSGGSEHAAAARDVESAGQVES